MKGNLLERIVPPEHENNHNIKSTESLLILFFDSCVERTKLNNHDDSLDIKIENLERDLHEKLGNDIWPQIKKNIMQLVFKINEKRSETIRPRVKQIQTNDFIVLYGGKNNTFGNSEMQKNPFDVQIEVEEKKFDEDCKKVAIKFSIQILKKNPRKNNRIHIRIFTLYLQMKEEAKIRGAIARTVKKTESYVKTSIHNSETIIKTYILKNGGANVFSK